MHDQLTLLRDTYWDILVILDACRVDAFEQVVLPQVTGLDVVRYEVARSPYIHTPGWIHRVGPMLVERGVTYFTANPVVDRECKRRRYDMRLISLWKGQWAYFSADRIPSVHPMAVIASVLTMRPLVESPIVVHLLQPHCPYIGYPPLAMGRMGQSEHEFGKACHNLPRPDLAVQDGKLTWAELRQAYLANLDLGWQAVLMLLAGLRPDTNVMITADHGELLGEDGKFGHEGNFTAYEQLWQVPWLQMTVGTRPASPDAGVKQKLEALGYV